MKILIALKSRSKNALQKTLMEMQKFSVSKLLWEQSIHSTTVVCKTYQTLVLKQLMENVTLFKAKLATYQNLLQLVERLIMDLLTHAIVAYVYQKLHHFLSNILMDIVGWSQTGNASLQMMVIHSLKTFTVLKIFKRMQPWISAALTISYQQCPMLNTMMVCVVLREQTPAQ